MGSFTVSKRIVKQGHTLAINLTHECKMYNLDAGQVINVTVTISEPNTDASEDNN